MYLLQSSAGYSRRSALSVCSALTLQLCNVWTNSFTGPQSNPATHSFLTRSFKSLLQTPARASWNVALILTFALITQYNQKPLSCSQRRVRLSASSCETVLQMPRSHVQMWPQLQPFNTWSVVHRFWGRGGLEPQVCSRGWDMLVST